MVGFPFIVRVLVVNHIHRKFGTLQDSFRIVPGWGKRFFRHSLARLLALRVKHEISRAAIIEPVVASEAMIMRRCLMKVWQQLGYA